MAEVSKPTATDSIARSPITPPEPVTQVAGWQVTGRRSTAELTLIDLTPLTKVQVKSIPTGAMEQILGVGFGRSRPIHSLSRPPADISTAPPADLIVGSGPGEWLLLAPPNTAPDVTTWCEKRSAAVTELVSIVDLTHGRALIRLSGAVAVHLLNKVCAIDFAEEVVPDGAALRSSVAKLATDLVRDDVTLDDGQRVRSYLLHCERSSGQYLFDALLDAGTEFGVDIDGFPGRFTRLRSRAEWPPAPPGRTETP